MDNQHQVKTKNQPDIEWQKLEVEKERLKLDAERLTLEKAKERTTKLLIVLPVVVSLVAISLSAYTERQRTFIEYSKAASTYNEGRFELFKKMSEPAANRDELRQIYAEIFPRDLITLRNEQRDTAGK